MLEKFKYINGLSKLIKHKILELAEMDYYEYWVFYYSIIGDKMKENICEKLIIDRNKYNRVKETALIKFDLTYRSYEKQLIEILDNELAKKEKHKKDEENADFLRKNADF